MPGVRETEFQMLECNCFNMALDLYGSIKVLEE